MYHPYKIQSKYKKEALAPKSRSPPLLQATHWKCTVRLISVATLLLFKGLGDFYRQLYATYTQQLFIFLLKCVIIYLRWFIFILQMTAYNYQEVIF